MSPRTVPSSRSFGRRTEPHLITISRGGRERSFTVRPWVALSVASVATVFAVTYLALTAYLVWRDDIIGAAIARQTRLQHAYEDRIAALRTQIDRINARQLVDQESFEGKITELIRRQDAVSEQHRRVAALLDDARGRGLAPRLGPETTGSVPAAKPAAAPQPQPLPERGLTDLLKSSALGSGWFGGAAPKPSKPDAGERIAAVESQLVRVANQQVFALDQVARAAEGRAERLERTARRLGLPIPQAGATTAEFGSPRAVAAAATGGPLVPIGPGKLLAEQLDRARLALGRLDRVEDALDRLPLGRPHAGEGEMTSGFGPRRDPFLGVMAMHTGVDFRGDTGDPILATADGTVINADREGGYGLMVEIDHGGGFTTRFGHMSAIEVSVGEKVKKGERIGRVGSTGRSTGPHIHYETRRDGTAVDPADFLDAGRQLARAARE